MVCADHTGSSRYLALAVRARRSAPGSNHGLSQPHGAGSAAWSATISAFPTLPGVSASGGPTCSSALPNGRLPEENTGELCCGRGQLKIKPIWWPATAAARSVAWNSAAIPRLSTRKGRYFSRLPVAGVLYRFNHPGTVRESFRARFASFAVNTYAFSDAGKDLPIGGRLY